MNLIPATIPKFIKILFPNLVWELPTEKKVIYLTFDDGPTPEITNWTLAVLKQYSAKATFFCIGHNVEKYPELFRKIITDGHSIGNHTYNHLKGWKTKTKDYINSIIQTENIFQTKSSNLNTSKTSLFRPPFGQIKPKQIKMLSELGYKIIMWNVLSVDWSNGISKAQCFKNVINNTTSGSIVIFHDSIKASKNMQDTLPKVLEYFSKKGFEFKRIPEQGL